MEKLQYRVKTLAVILAMMLVCSASAWANITAKGTVTDSTGEPLIGVSVVEQGQANGVTTDIDGNFTISVADGAKITFTYIGFETQTLAASTDMKVVLKESSTMLDEVVAVGYGVQKKSVVTASIVWIMPSRALLRVLPSLHRRVNPVRHRRYVSVVSAQSITPILSTS